jgi:hypothetical protein
MEQAVMPMTRYITEASTLAPAHRQLLARRTAGLEGSDGEEGEVEDDEIGRSLRLLADELVLSTSVSDSTWASLAGGHDVTWLMDAVETVAQVSFLCRLARSFGVCPPDPAAPRRQPAPTGARPAGARPAGARIEPVDGDQIAVLRTLARHPVMAAARRPRAAFVNQMSPLTPHDRETLILRMGWDCRCEYEWAKHVGSVGHARQHGVEPALVAAGPAAPGVSAGDALLMRIADELYRDATLSDDTWSALLERHGLSRAMSAVFTASSYRATSMSLNAYGVQLEPGDEGFPRPAR